MHAFKVFLKPSTYGLGRGPARESKGGRRTTIFTAVASTILILSVGYMG